MSTRAAVVPSFSQTSDRKEDSMQQSLWPGRTSWNVNIHWEHLVDASNRRVVLAEDAATDSASAHRDDYFGFRHRPIRFQNREFHVAGARPMHQDHAGMPG